MVSIAIRDTIPALSVYYKGSLNEKMESYTKPTITSIKVSRTINPFHTKMENHKRTCSFEPKKKKKKSTEGSTPVQMYGLSPFVFSRTTGL